MHKTQSCDCLHCSIQPRPSGRVRAGCKEVWLNGIVCCGILGNQIWERKLRPMFFNIHVCVCIDYSTYKLVFISFATYTVSLSVKSFTFLTISGTRYFGFPLFQISCLKKRKFVLMYLAFALETTYSWKELERVPMLSRLAHQNTITYVVSSAPVNRSSPVG